MCSRGHMSIPYTCDAKVDGKPCGKQALAAFYRLGTHAGWSYLCSSHVHLADTYDAC
jgi:hypothetical protein